MPSRRSPRERRRLVVGNWKMNGRLRDLAELMAIDRAAADLTAVEVGVALPLTLLATAAQAATTLSLGSQDFDIEQAGPQTGCVSAAMVRDAGASFSIIGHSEVRARGENDDTVSRKLDAAVQAGLTPLLCVGESEADRAAGRTVVTISGQLAIVPSVRTGELWVAYEPRWAIGSGRSAEPRQIAAVHAMLRGVLAPNVRLLYGGSVTPENATAIMAGPDVDGVLVGGASLTASSLNLIAGHAANIP